MNTGLLAFSKIGSVVSDNYWSVTPDKIWLRTPDANTTYKTSKDMPEELKKALPPIEALKKLLDVEDMGEE